MVEEAVVGVVGVAEEEVEGSDMETLDSDVLFVVFIRCSPPLPFA